MKNVFSDEKTAELVNIEIELDAMWLAAALGHMTVRVDQMNYFVFICQIEPYASA